MQNLNSFSSNKKTKLSQEEIESVIYHDLFEFPMTLSDLIKWKAGSKFPKPKRRVEVCLKDGFYFLEGRKGFVYKRKIKERVSAKKLKIAQKAANILSIIFTVEMVGVTGSLAMQSSDLESDIDIIVITKNNFLWTTRLFAYLILKIFGFSIRKPGDVQQMDRLCLNMWVDRGNMVFDKKERNVYTAHELAQIKPLVNRDRCYQELMFKNSWISDYWPNAVKIKHLSLRKKNSNSNLFSFFEKVAYDFQRAYMKRKMSREKVSKHRAFFHPVDWYKIVKSKIYT